MSRYAQPMSQTLAEMKMNDPKLLKVFNKLKPKATVKIKHSSTLEKGKDFIEYIVKSKNTLRNGVEKITLARKDSPTSVKRFLYNRDGKVTFAVGDMAASIDDIKENLEEGYEKEVLNVLSDAGIDGYFRNGKLYVDKRDAKDAKAALEDADNIIKLPKMVKEEVELEEMKYTHAVVDPDGRVAGMSSNEKDAKDIASRHKGKVVKLKKPMAPKKGDMMINRPLEERPIDPADVDDDATDADKKAADKNMIMQMRKAMDVKGNMKIEFGDGKKEKVDPKILQMMVTAHGKIEKPRDKEKFVAMISKSKRDMLNVAKKLSTLKMDLDKEDEPIVKKVVQMLKKASKAHAGQADDLDKAIKEALELDEGTWALPDTPKEKSKLKLLLKSPIKLGRDGNDATNLMYPLIGDDELMDDLYVAGKKDPRGDARPVIKKAMKRLGIKEEMQPEAYKPVKANHYDVKIQGVKKKDVNAILKYIKVDGGNYDIEDVDADQVTGGGMSSTSDGDIFIQGDDAGKLGMEIAKKFRGVKVMGEGIELDENYRKLAMMGIGTETKKAAKVGLKTDYYLPKNGDKSFGKITRVTSSGYEITDEKTKKVHKFKFYDPNNDPTSVRGTREEVELDEVTMSKALNIDPKDADRMKTLAVLYTRAMKLPAGSPKQDKFKKEIEKLRKELGMNESTFKELVKSVELDEKYDLYHKTFSDAMQHAYDYAKKKLGITVDPKEIDNKVATGPRKPSEGKTNKYRLKGKGGNLQIQVYNKGGSKPFELNMYKEENEMSDKLTDGNISLKETVLKVWQEAAKDKDEGFASDAQRKAAFASGYKEKGKKKDKEEGNEFSGALDKARKAGKKTFKVGGKEYPVEPAKKESVERYHETKQGSLRDAVLQMWGEGVKEDKKTLTKEKKNGIKKMTDTGKEVTPVETSVKMPKIKETNNKV